MLAPEPDDDRTGLGPLRLRGARSGTVKEEDPIGVMALSYSSGGANYRVTRVWSTAPSQLALARHAGVFPVSP